MTPDEFIALVNERFTYKPEFKIRAKREDYFHTAVVVKFERKVQDSTCDPRDYTRLITVVHQPSFTETEIEHWDEYIAVNNVLKAIRLMEMHEVDEWARLDGKLLSDPHKGV